MGFGRTLRELRTAKDFSLEELAERSGVSIGLVSQLERGIGNPSLLTIGRIAYALGIPISTFFEAGESSEAVVRRDRRKRLMLPELAERGLLYELLTPDLKRALEAIWVEMPPGLSTEDRPFEHQGEEFGIVLKGRLEVHVGDEVHLLGPGDSVSYRSSVPHWYANRGSVAVKSVWVVTPPSF